MASRQEFLDGIVPGMEIGEMFYKRVYCQAYEGWANDGMGAHDVLDSSFLSEVAVKLAQTGNRQAVQGYNEWLKAYREERDAMEREVSQWYRGEVDRQYREWLRKNVPTGDGEEVNGCNKMKCNTLQEMNNKELLMLLMNLTKGA